MNTHEIVAEIDFQIEDYQIVIDGVEYHVDASARIYGLDRDDSSQWQYDIEQIGTVTRKSDLEEMPFTWAIEEGTAILDAIKAKIVNDASVAEALEENEG